jgi:hypothetical protein
MYVHAIDESSATLLGIFTGAKEPDDIERNAHSMQRVDRIAQAQGRGALFVVVPDPEYAMPTSRDRQRFADIKDSCRATPSLFILVTRSALLRGVITAVSWLSPSDERYRMTACESFAAVLARAGQYRSESPGSLRRMERELRGGLKMRRVG